MSIWSRFDVLSKMEHVGLCQTVNAKSVEEYLRIAEALIAGGITNIEILQRSGKNEIPKINLDAIYELRKRFPHPIALIGAGTVQTKERAQAVIDNGAEFVVSNLTDEGVIETANLNCVLVIPGARSDADVRTAMRLGCWIVKLFMPFPALSTKANLAYLAQYRGCFPRMEFLLTAGITLDNAFLFINAGYPVLIPGGVVSPKMVEAREWAKITEMAKNYVDVVAQARKV